VRPLSEGGLGVFVVSTFDGDHLLLKTGDMPEAVALLGQAGHVLTSCGGAPRDILRQCIEQQQAPHQTPDSLLAPD